MLAVLALAACGVRATWYQGGAFDGSDEAVGAGAAGLPQVSNGEGAADVTDSSARLTGMLLHTGSAPARVVVFWGATDGETNAAAWEEEYDLGTVPPFEPLSHPVSLIPGHTYFYRFFATNTAGESAWAYPASASFTTPAPPVVTAGSGAVYGRSSAVLNGELVSGVYADITILYGADPDAWSATNSLGLRTLAGSEIAPNPFRLLVDGLTPETTYAYVVRAENPYGAAETEPIWFTTGPDHFVTAEGTAWFGGGSYDGYDDQTVAELMPGSGGTLLLLR